MSIFKKKDKKVEVPAESADSSKNANISKSISTPDIAGAPKGTPPSKSGKSSKDGKMTLSKAEDDAQEDERLEERKRLWTKVSGLVGKDIASLLSLPVSFFEPLTVLQSMAEPMRNVQLLNLACECDDPVERICRVAAFCVSLFSYYVRTAKPFNPVLGETFEYEPADKAYKTLCEQVSHHPPVGIAYSDSKDWSLFQESRIETKFWGTSVDINSIGNNVLNFKKYNEEIRWKNPTAVIHNIILGRLWIEYHGSLPITSSTGHTASLNFKKQSWFGSNAFGVSGEIKDKDGKVKAEFSGNWKENAYASFCRVDENGKKGELIPLWKKVSTPEEKSHKWKWDAFIHQLTAITPELEQNLPETDSRLRGDLRALSSLNTKLAGKEKIRIEEKERAKRKEREVAGQAWKPVYFTKVPDSQYEYRWSYSGNYWEDREERAKDKREKGNTTVTAPAPAAEDDDDDEPVEEGHLTNEEGDPLGVDASNLSIKDASQENGATPHVVA